MEVTCRIAVMSLLVVAAVAQEPAPDEVFAARRAQLVADTKAQLKADDLAKVAWGAHAAAEYRLTECVAGLIAALAPLAPQSSERAKYAALAVLDALVETNAVAAGEALAPFLGDPALALLGRSAEHNRALLLAQFRKLGPMDEAGAACGTWLANLEDRDFLRDLLLAPVAVDILVTDGQEDPIAALQETPALGHYRPKVPEGFPHTLHHLRVGDARDVRSIRTERTTHLGGFCLPFNPYEPRLRGARNAWLRRLLGEHAAKLEIDRAPLVAVKWEDESALRATIAELRTKIEAEHRALVDTCVAAKLVAAESGSRTPAIAVELSDYRMDQKVALPESKEWKVREW